MSRDLIPDALALPPACQLPSGSDADSAIYLTSPAPTRGHQRSRTTTDLPPLYKRTQSTSPTRSTFLPFLRPQSVRSISPERVSVAEASEFAVSSVDSGTKKKTSSAVEKLASWFDGSSEPVNITLVPSPRKEKLDPVSEHVAMENIFSASQDSIDNLTRRPKRPSLAAPSTSKFNFFRRSTVSLAPNNVEADELANLDIDEALFPHGQPDEFSPAAFKNLQQNAEGTIRRFQQAYTEEQKSLRTTTSAKNVLTDELEAAQTRNETLKLQLEEMAERAAEQERIIMDLRAQLASQRPSLESHQSQQQSVRIVPQDERHEPDSSRSRYRRKRSSDVSTSGESELGSDVSSVVSVFSEVLSVAPSQTISIPNPVMKSNSASHRGDCANCHGLSATDSWDVVNVMRLESAALKQRIAQLENAQDDALNFLSGLKLS